MKAGHLRRMTAWNEDVSDLHSNQWWCGASRTLLSDRPLSLSSSRDSCHSPRTPIPPPQPPRQPRPNPTLQKHKRANPETRLRGWRGLEELGQGKGASDVAQEERKGAPEADVGEGASCVIINKALKKSVHIKAYRGYAIIHESNALWPNVS